MKNGFIVVMIMMVYMAADGSVLSEFQITTDENDQKYPEVYEDIVVWDDMRNGNLSLSGCDLDTREEFHITTLESDASYSAVYGDIIVWHDWRNRNLDIYGYNVSTQEEFQITADEYHQNIPAANSPYREKSR